MFLNKVIIIGNLTRDPELKSLPSGMKVANLGIATNHVWKDKDGNKQESTEFHSVAVFGRQAENVAQYMKKGNSLLVEGRLQTRSWEADGVKKYKTEIIADNVQFGPKNSGQSSEGDYSKPSSSDNEGKSGGIEYPEEDINTDDIPF